MILIIEKEANNVFSLTYDGGESIRTEQNRLTTVGDFTNFKTANGANLILKQNIFVEDITVIASGTFNFTDINDLWNKLIEIGFFDGVSTSGGGTVIDRFDELADTFDYFGRDGQVVTVNESQLRLETQPISLFTPADRDKLDGIQAEAEVNVQADASVTDPNNPAYIKNFPNIPDIGADKENTANKQDSLAVDGTGVKFPTVDAINERYNLVENIRLNSDFPTNLFLGDGAGQDNTPLSTTIGRQNTFLGVNAGRFNTTGYARTDIGYNAGYFNTTGDGNCNIGYQSGFLNISGNYNTNVGTDAGARNRGSRNSFWGWHSGFGFSTFSTGEDNHILGYETAINLLTGFGNNGHGGRVFYNLTDGYNNTAMGDLSGFNLTTGNSNSLYGRDSGFSLDAQVSNSIFGNRAGYNLKGNFNTILGEFAGFDLTSGNGNVYIGQGSGNNPLQKVNAAETIVIGSSAYATKNNQAVIGRNGGITETILRGKILIGTETNNNIDDLQINGTISASPATLANQVVVKSQLDLKADLASPALTGTPTAPTATAGTNTTQIATTAFVTNADSGNVKTTGDQNILGIKSIANISAGITNGFSFTNTGTEANNGVLRVRNTNSGIGLYSTNEGSGNGIVSNTTTAGTGNNFTGRNNGTNTFIVDKLGTITSNALAGTGTRIVTASPTGQLNAGNSPLLYTNQTITANKTVTTSDFVNNNELILSVNATSGNITITLPTFTALQGYKVTVKKVDSSANSVLIQGVGGINIDGQPSLTVSGQYSSSTVGANLSQYIIL